MNTCHSQIDRWPFSASDRASQLTVTWKNSCREFELFNVIQNCITFKRLFTATCLEINWDKTCRELVSGMHVFIFYLRSFIFKFIQKYCVCGKTYKMYFRTRGSINLLWCENVSFDIILSCSRFKRGSLVIRKYFIQKVFSSDYPCNAKRIFGCWSCLVWLSRL